MDGGEAPEGLGGDGELIERGARVQIEPEIESALGAGGGGGNGDGIEGGGRRGGKRRGAGRRGGGRVGCGGAVGDGGERVVGASGHREMRNAE